MTLTHHSKDRLRERVGLNKSASERMAQKALERGLQHSDVGGSFRRYLDSLYLSHGNANNLRVYGEFVYLFRGSVLVTVLNLPRQFRGRKK